MSRENLNLNEMKKKLLFSTIVVVFLSASTIFITSCNKDEYFDSTTWVGEFETVIDGSDAEFDVTLTFIGNQVNAKMKMKYEYYEEYSGEWRTESGTITAKGTYSYDKKTVTMNVENDDNDIDDTWIGKVDKDRMTLNISLDKWGIDEQVIFTKQ